ncbi:hypothetical protein NitYY0826_C1747 [Nitratiruptor sp. YY08-26]|uniref:hypothetical protein n=1 Tax=unclassified Nitratiruptor TaxID=2624044 RepID=UPI001916C137|nr:MULTISPECIES: hypothetical protein [unclassified Nitratiruptor]BCD62862.1 hypothetical protein NitYY0813_C1745 [Nitratiruptor sp. YY08-13]BCD66798.1 hypothetical protein NitYY0826_C1747 [Nitratiruptor sp. YY08-26]
MGLHKLQKKLEKIFSHPIPANLDWRGVENLLKHLGFTVEHTKKNHIKVIDKEGKELLLIVHNHEINSKEEITKLKHFLQEHGITDQTKL